MKKILITLMLAGGLVAALAQGTVNINTIGSTGWTAGAGDAVGLYAGADGASGAAIAETTFLAPGTALFGVVTIPAAGDYSIATAAEGYVISIGAGQLTPAGSTSPPQTITGAGNAATALGGGPVDPPIPEPSTIALAIFGAAALLLRRRK